MNLQILTLPPENVHHGKNLEYVMELYGISQSQIAEFLGVSRQAVHRMIHTKKMRPETLKGICNALNLKEREFDHIRDHPFATAFSWQSAELLLRLATVYSKNRQFKKISKMMLDLEEEIKAMEAK